MTKEQVIDKHFPLGVPFTENSGNYEFDFLHKAMDEYAQSISLAYDEWKWANRWHLLENGFWYQTLEHPCAMSDKTYNKHHRKTPQELYNQFIEQQTKDK